MTLLYSIGEVSRITALSLKALRLYQEKGLLQPTRIDDETGYRYYSQRDVERAQAIRALRDLQFSMEEIRDVLARLDEGGSLSDVLAQMRSRLAQEVAGAQRALLAVDALMQHEEHARAYLRAPPAITQRELPAQRVAVLRARGRYSDANVMFPRLFGAVAMSVVGAPFCLLHEAEYREEDADISWCVPVQEALEAADGVGIETLPGQTAVTVLHTGPYDSVGPSWARLFAHVRSMNREVRPPLRESYLRGPGLQPIDPGAYVTELAVLLP